MSSDDQVGEDAMDTCQASSTQLDEQVSDLLDLANRILRGDRCYGLEMARRFVSLQGNPCIMNHLADQTKSLVADALIAVTRRFRPSISPPSPPSLSS